MEPNRRPNVNFEGVTHTYYHHYPEVLQQQTPNHQPHESGPPQPPPPTTTTSTTTTNTNANSPTTNGISDASNSLSYPQSVAGKAPEPQRRKRGRPRKYGTPEAAAAAKRAAGPIKRKEQQEQQQQQQQNQQPQHHHHQFVHGSSSHSSSASSRKSNFAPVGGQGFTPHVINVAAGEDVGQKIMSFMHQTKRELCILSASGSISSASLRQPAISGGNMTYQLTTLPVLFQGFYDIISLTGSYVCSDGGKAGGLSACLSSTDGMIVGGGIGGPLIAAGPVEVIVATFLMDHKKDGSAGFKGDASASTTIPSPASASTAVYRPVVDDHQNMDGNPFMMQSQWRGEMNYSMGGNTGHSSHDSPENGDYEQIPD